MPARPGAPERTREGIEQCQESLLITAFLNDRKLSYRAVTHSWFGGKRPLNPGQKPQVIADVTNFVAYANANVAATPLLDPSIANDTASYSTPAQRELMFVQTESTPEQARAITRLWEKFKTAQ